MPRVSQKPVNVFNKGLITEAGELTFPEGASVDELNCALLRDGSRRRRLAIKYETGYTTSSTATLADGDTSSVHLWENVAGQAGLNFVVIQINNTLHFYEEGSTVSENKKSFTLDLTTYARPTTSGVGSAKVQITSVLGTMVVASPEVNTFYVEYSVSGDSISATEISFRIRDFKWIGDRSAYDANDATPTEARKYDTYNAGWGSTLGSAARTTYGTWPKITLPWYSGKDASGNFSAAEWNKIEGGSSLIGNGFYIYDLYDIDRSTASGFTLTAFDYTEDTRFKCVESYASRVFYSGMGAENVSNVFFSRIVQQPSDLGECLQANDPTSEDFPDLLDTDGGVINIPEAYNIKRLHVIGTSLFVFAENGVWAIRGIDESFSATAYYVSKIAEVGVKYTDSFVVSDSGTPYWWSELGIHTLAPSNDGMSFRVTNISLPTIQGFFDEIRPTAREQVVAAHDGFNKRVVWMYPSNDETKQGKLTKALWLDEQIAAFFPWEFGDSASDEYVIAPFFLRNAVRPIEQFDVIDSSGNLVVDSSGNQVISYGDVKSFDSGAIKLLVRTSTSNRISFAEFSGTDFLDWGTVEYSSYVEGAYDFSGDLTTKKNHIYITTYCKTTESEVTEALDGSLNLDRPSSCMISTYWDYRKLPSQSPQEAYRLKELPVLTAAGDLNYPKTVITSRLRLRGRGRSVRVRFESDGSNDFHILGYDLITQSKGSL